MLNANISTLKEKYTNNPVIGKHLDLLSQDKGSALTSTRYSPITTLEVLDFFTERGFSIEKINKTFPLKKENIGFEKHKLVLTPPKNIDLKIDGLTPKLHVLNSYDAGQSLQFYLGVYRLICSNGLVVGKGIFHERIIHVGDVMGKLHDALNRSENAFDRVSSQIKDWQNFELNHDQISALAIEMLKVRLPKNTESAEYFFRSRDISAALRVKRADDNRNDLFTVFNRLQESIVQRPRVQYIKQCLKTGETRLQSLRNINAFKASQLNSVLWEKASDFYKEVA